MSGPFRKIITGATFFLLICVTAVCGYVSAGWQLNDAIYMVIITIFGVGYGEVQPVQSPGLRALTISVIVAGYAAVIYTVGGFVQMLIDGEINRALGARRMTRGIERMQDHAIICGFGRIGTMLCRELQHCQRPFVVIDVDRERIEEAQQQGYLVLQGNATDEETLIRAGIQRARALVTVLTDDAANVFITITARDLNPKLDIIARGEDPSTEKKLLRCGASRVVLPTAIGAARMAQLIARPSAESLLEMASQQHSLHEELKAIGLQLDELLVAPGSPLIARTLADIEIHGNRGFLVVAVRSVTGQVRINPPGDLRLEAGDTVIVLGHEHDLPQLAERYVLRREITYRGVKMST